MNLNKLAPSVRSASLGRVIRMMLAAASWTLLMLTLLTAGTLAGWVLLWIVVLHGRPPGAQPVGLILVSLLALSVGLAWLVTRLGASARSVVLALGLGMS